MIGLGTAAKLYPLFLLGAMLVICVRRRELAQLVTVVSSAVIVWVLANAPAYLTGPDQWKLFWTFNSDRGADLGSIWLLIAQAGDVAFAVDTINSWSLWLLRGVVRRRRRARLRGAGDPAPGPARAS